MSVLRACDYAPIVVVIPSFRCSHLMDTILGLYQAARHPLRVHMSVLEHAGEEGSVADMVRQRLEGLGLFMWASNVTWAQQPQAWGPAHARAMACTNYKPFQYALHIHAHMANIEKHWDARLIEDYEALLLRNGHARDLLLSTHPDEHAWHYLRFQSQLHAGYGLPVTESAPCHGPGNKRVALTTAIWCDKFSFGHAAIHEAVPFDAGLRVITDCVDLVYSARLHAAGIRLMHPPHTYMSHQSGDQHGCATYWQCTPSSASLRAAEQVSQRRLKCQLGLLRVRAIQPEMKDLPPVLELHHLESYGRFAGIHFGSGTVLPAGAWGLTSHGTAKEYFIKTGLV